MQWWLVKKVMKKKASNFLKFVVEIFYQYPNFATFWGLKLNLLLCVTVLQVWVYIPCFKVTSLLPVLLLPLFGIMDTGEVSKVFYQCYPPCPNPPCPNLPCPALSWKWQIIIIIVGGGQESETKPKLFDNLVWCLTISNFSKNVTQKIKLSILT